MSFTITGYTNFSKRINSTKRPTDGTNITILGLKFPCSVEQPEFTLDVDDANVSRSIDYVKWGSRYYYVTDTIYENNKHITLKCDIDVLATYKTNILDTNAFVEYATASYNGMIQDRRLSTSETVIQSDKWSSPIVTAQHGTYILTTASNDLSAIVGFSSMYAIDVANARKVANWLYDDSVTATILKAFDNPSSAIIGCHWIPWELSTGGDLVHIGDEITGTGTGDEAYGNGLHQESEAMLPNSTIVEIPWVDGPSSAGMNWMNYSPYSDFVLYLPFYGTVSLDPAKLQGHSEVIINYKMDPINGDVTYQVACGTWKETYKTNQAVQLAIGQSQPRTGIGQAMGGALAVGGAAIAATAGLATPVVAAAGAIGGVSSMVNGQLSFFKDTNTGGGVNGGKGSAYLVLGSSPASMFRCATITRYTHAISDGQGSNVNVHGRPLFANRTLRSLGSGYVKCAGASVNIAGYETEKEKVNSYVNSGIYLE